MESFLLLGKRAAACTQHEGHAMGAGGGDHRAGWPSRSGYPLTPAALVSSLVLSCHLGSIPRAWVKGTRDAD